MLRPACLAALVATACTVGWSVLPAAAEPTDGTLTVAVVLDDGSGGYDGADVGQSGVPVTVTDPGGATVSQLTGEDGRVVVPPGDELSGGHYFVTVDLPSSLGLVALPDSAGFAPLSSTVDVTSDSQEVVVGVGPVPGPAPEPEPEPSSTEASAPEPEAPTAPPAEPPPAPDPGPAPDPAGSPAPRFAVGDRVWHDLDGQGRQDDGEPGAVGISVQLLDANGGVVASTTTDREGRYVFDDLPAGFYAVRFAGLPSGTKLSPTGVGGGSGDSDADYTGATAPFDLSVGGPDVRRSTAADDVGADYVNPTVDAGVAPLRFAVASLVWQDLDRDGVLDPEEPAGRATVALLDASGRERATTTADEQGRFVFGGLGPGSYRLQFSELGEHRQLTTARVGTNRAVDSAPDPADGRTALFQLGQGSADLVPAASFGDVDADFVLATLNAGTVGSYTITNLVWKDANGDGLLNAGEVGVAGVRVQLRNARDAVVDTTTTDRDGRFTFDRLSAGRYRLRFLPPEGLYFTRPRAGAAADVDSAVYGNSFTAPITVGEDNPVETAVAAGLTTSAAAAAGTVAPPLVDDATPGALAGAPLAEPDGVPLALPWIGAGLAVGGAAAVVLARRRRRT